MIVLPSNGRLTEIASLSQIILSLRRLVLSMIFDACLICMYAASTDPSYRLYVCIPTLQQTIPMYFDNQIAFASFQRKLQRCGFKQRTSRRAGHCEFCSPTFKRLGADSAPAAAVVAADAVNTSGNAGIVDSIQVQQQPTQASASSPLLQQVLARINQLPAPNPPPSQTDANAITALLSNTLRNNQQPSIASQQSVLNYADANRILQGIMGSNQLPLPSSRPTPSQQPVPNHATQFQR
jgi:hypothetical protein